MKTKSGKRKLRLKCKECGRVLNQEYEDCCLCGGGLVYVCPNSDCRRMYDAKGDEL